MLGQSRSQAAVALGSGAEPMVPKEPPTGLRLPADVKEALRKLAKADDRSVSYVINKILADYLRARKLIK
jgi:hypothetical protein